MTRAHATRVQAYCAGRLANLSAADHPGIVANLRAKLAGAETVLARPHCARCGAQLSATASVVAGLGPECRRVAA